MKIYCTFSSLFLLSASLLAEEIVISQKNKEFSNKEITIKPGDTIAFKNDDTVTHNVFSTSEEIKFDLKTQKPGETSKVSFDKAGSGEVRCAIHPGMKLKLTVK